MILKNRDLESLNLLYKMVSFVVTIGDVESFVKWAIKDKWIQGAKSMLGSSAARSAFSSTSLKEQSSFVEKILLAVGSIEDLKQRRAFTLSLVEDS